jgi:hypothetical protein
LPLYVVRDLAVLPDGRILVAGTHTGDAAVARLLADGTVDPAFSTARIDPKFRFDSVEDIALTSDNRILAGASGFRAAGAIRLRDDGRVDKSYSQDGTVWTPIRGNNTDVRIALEPDGAVLVQKRFEIARFGVAPGPADADGDGVGDETDLCPAVFFESRRGCPTAPRSSFTDVNFHARGGGVTGYLEGGCNGDVYVKLYRARKGRDRFVGRDFTLSGSAEGFFYIDARISRGRYYLVAPRVVPAEVLLCPKFVSKRYRVR